MVPESMQSQVFWRVHDHGHFSATKTEAAVRRDYWIANLKSKVEKVLAKRKQGKQEDWLHVIDKGSVLLYTYHVDHFGPLESSAKK